MNINLFAEVQSRGGGLWEPAVPLSSWESDSLDSLWDRPSGFHADSEASKTPGLSTMVTQKQANGPLFIQQVQ